MSKGLIEYKMDFLRKTFQTIDKKIINPSGSQWVQLFLALQVTLGHTHKYFHQFYLFIYFFKMNRIRIFSYLPDIFGL